MEKTYAVICPDCSKVLYVKLDKEAHPPKEPKVQYGECGYVWLTANQHQTLMDRFDVNLCNEVINKLDRHIGKKSKDPYRNHYSAIQDWVVPIILKENKLRPDYHKDHKSEHDLVLEELDLKRKKQRPPENLKQMMRDEGLNV